MKKRRPPTKAEILRQKAAKRRNDAKFDRWSLDVLRGIVAELKARLSR